jgi:hypothetical protein
MSKWHTIQKKVISMLSPDLCYWVTNATTTLEQLENNKLAVPYLFLLNGLLQNNGHHQ